MIIVWGSVEAPDENFEEMRRLSLEHVARSRGEPGCLSHTVSVDAENLNRLNFFEEWDDMDALQRHFKVGESAAFAAQLVALSVKPPEMRIFDASHVG